MIKRRKVSVPVTLYHGTDATTAQRALSEGLRTRRATGRDSLWQECPSGADRVYLTDGYAPVFASHAASLAEMRGEDGRWGIVEVRVPLKALIPDEDYLEQAQRSQNGGALDRTNTLLWRDMAPSLTGLAQASLKGLGTVAHLGDIPASCVTRVSLYGGTNPLIRWNADDRSVCLLSHRVNGVAGRAYTGWLFGDKAGLTDVDMRFGLEPDDPMFTAEQRAALVKMWNNDDGLTIIHKESR